MSDIRCLSLSSRLTKTGEYSHSFCPFMGAIVSSESSRIYEHALQQLNTLIERISGKRKNIQNTILAFLHDAAPGANAAAQKILGRGVTNGTKERLRITAWRVIRISFVRPLFFSFLQKCTRSPR